MLGAALAAVVAALDILLRVVPGTARVGHEHGHRKAGDGNTAEQTDNTGGSKDQAGDDRNDNSQQRRGDHLMQGALGAQADAGRVIRVCLVVHDTDDLAELTAHFHDDGLRSGLHSAHGQCGENEGEHRADEQADQDGRARQREVEGLGRAGLHDVDVGHEQRQSGQGSRADREALAGGSSGVAKGIKRVGAVADFFRQTGHLGNAAGVVGHGAVSVGRKGDAEGGEHADSGNADAVQALVELSGERAAGVDDRGGAACAEVAEQDSDGNDQNGSHGGLQAQRDTADDDRGGAGLGSGGQLLRGLIVVRGVVLGEVADGAAADQAAEDRNVDAPAVLLGSENQVGQGQGEHSGKGGSRVGAGAQALEQGHLGGVFLRLDEEGADQRADNAANGQRDGQQHAAPAVVGGGAQREGGKDGADIGLVQVSAHTGNVADVIANVIRDGRGVTRVIFRNTGFDFTDEVGADVSSLGVDAAADTGEQRHEGSAHAVHDHDVGKHGGIGDLANVAQADKPERDVQNAEADDREAHDRAGREGNVQAVVQALVRGVGRAGIGGGSNLHADQAGEHRPDTTGQEGKRRHSGEHLTLGSKGNDQQDDKYDCKHFCNSGILLLQVGVGTGADRRSDLDHLFVALRALHNFALLQVGENQGERGSDEADPE